jgi:MoxR-like ATPase
VDDQLIGRERERALLQACVTEALAGSGSLVLLAGEAGVGKTTVARRVLAGSDLEVLEVFGVQGAPPRSVPSWRCCGRACARRGPAG